MPAELAQMTIPLPGNSKSDEFYTPARIFDPLHVEFRFTIDVCATSESRKVPRFYSRATNALLQSWRGERVWCNPPYSDIRAWTEKAYAEMTAGGCELIAMLLPVWTDRAWWHDFIEPLRTAGRIELRLIRGRIRFGMPGDPEGKTGTTGTFPSVVVVWR